MATSKNPPRKTPLTTAPKPAQKSAQKGAQPAGKSASRPAAKPTTIAAYIQAAPAAGQPLLRQLHALLKAQAPKAEEAIKWNTPFFVEPRFVFAFSAHKAHASFVPPEVVMAAFREELRGYQTTKGTLKLPYDQPLPEDLLRRMAQRSVAEVAAREGDAFW